MSFLRYLLKKPQFASMHQRRMQEKSRKNKELGDVGEQIACDHLSELGFEIIDRNVRYKMGEIDIVAMKGREIHFIEVKTRTNALFASPLESITKTKKTRIKRAAQMFMYARNNFNEDNLPPCYYDVISIDCSAENPHVELILDAFE